MPSLAELEPEIQQNSAYDSRKPPRRKKPYTCMKNIILAPDGVFDTIHISELRRYERNQQFETKVKRHGSKTFFSSKEDKEDISNANGACFYGSWEASCTRKRTRNGGALLSRMPSAGTFEESLRGLRMSKQEPSAERPFCSGESLRLFRSYGDKDSKQPLRMTNKHKID